MEKLGSIAGSVYRFFGRHQVLKNSVIAGSLMGGGDMISQLFIERTKKYSYIRTGRFIFLGSVVLGPVLYRWYGILEKVKFKSTAATAFARMSVDQITLAPSFLYLFFWMNDGLQGFSPKEIKKHIRRDYTDVLIANYQLWPGIQIINFSLVPLAHRVLFAQTAALFWNTYLAWKMNREEIVVPEPESI